MRAVVVVGGDAGRSPRMQYHARALAASGVDVDLVGYDGVPVPRFIADTPRIRVHRLAEPRLRFKADRRSKIIFGFLATIDATIAAIRLLAALLTLGKFDLLLVQNPPSLPTLQVARLVCRLRGARFVIDWHNL